MSRYRRQTPILGEHGQRRLAGAAVHIEGNGPADQWAARYLVAAGIGHCGAEQMDLPLAQLNPDPVLGPTPASARSVRALAQPCGEAIASRATPWPEVQGALAAIRAIMSILEEP